MPKEKGWLILLFSTTKKVYIIQLKKNQNKNDLIFSALTLIHCRYYSMRGKLDIKISLPCMKQNDNYVSYVNYNFLTSMGMNGAFELQKISPTWS